MAARNPFASSVPDIYDPYARPFERRTLSTGYYFIRSLLIVGGVCGMFVALYRNDVLRDLSRRVGQEPGYLAAERFLVGTPGWGTPRSMEPVLNESDSPSAPTVATPALAATAPTSDPVAATTPPGALAAATTPSAPAAAVDPLTPVSLDSLPVLTHSGAAAPAVSFADLPKSGAAAPAPHAASPAAVSRPAPAAPAPKVKASRVSLDDDSAPAPAPVAKKAAAPAGPKVTDAHKNDNPLMAAVRGAVRARPPKETVPAAH